MYFLQIICKENCKYGQISVLPLEKETDQIYQTQQSQNSPKREKLRNFQKRTKTFCGDNYIRVDRLFLFLSPILFLIFNCIYWLTYCSKSLYWKKEGLYRNKCVNMSNTNFILKNFICKRNIVGSLPLSHLMCGFQFRSSWR